MQQKGKAKNQLSRALAALEARYNRLKRALQESEERYRTIIESIEDGYYEVDLAGNFTFFNDSMCRIFGYPRQELMGMNNRQYTDPVSAKKVFEAYHRVYTTREPGRGFDFEIVSKEGAKRFIEVSISLQKDPTGNPIGFRGIVRDITERKKAEEALQRSEETAKQLAQENAIIAEVGRIVSSTLDIERIYGHFAQEVKKLIPFDRIAINTLDYQAGTVTVAYVTGVDVRNRLKGTAIPLAGTVAGEVVRARRGMIIQGEDPTKVTDRFPGLLSSFQAGIRSLMAIPLISKDEVVGALHFHSTKLNGYREKHLRLAEEVGNQIAGTIANAQLFNERQRAEEALRQSEEKYRTILANIEEGYYEVDLAGNFTFFNDSMCRILGYPKQELTGMNNRQYTDRENAKRLFQAFHKVYTTGEPGRGFDNELIRKDGTKRYVEASISLKKDAAGQPVGFRGIVRDITERKRFEKVLRQERETFFSILQKEPYGALLIDTDEKFLYLNPEFTAITGYTIADVPNGREWFRKAYPDQEYRHKIISMWKKDVIFRKGADRIWSVACKGGEVKEIEFKLTFLDDRRVIVMLSDVTERRRTEEELAYRATHDLLTGLPNRMLFKDRFSVAVAQAQRARKKLAIVFVDLDRFKEVNDTLGHYVGDRLLCAVGNRLTEFVRKTDTVARMGGDEFLLLLAEVDRVEDATTIARKAMETIQDPFVVNGHEISVTASIGIAFYPDDGNEVDTLVNCADKVMYSAKQKGFDTGHAYLQNPHGETSD